MKCSHLLETWQTQTPSEPARHTTNVLIVGARGQVGISCVHHWLSAGAEVSILGTGEAFYNHPHLHWLTGDIQNPASLKTITALPQTVIFTPPIWLLPPLMPWLIKNGVKRLIAFSSTSVHTKKTSGNEEERKLASSYQQSEDAIFTAAAAAGMNVTIFRPTLIYGFGLDRNITGIARVMKHLPMLPVPLNLRGLRQPVHAEDLAKATLTIADNPETYGKSYEVAGAEQLTYGDMLKRIARTLQQKVILIPVPGFAKLIELAGKLLGKSQDMHGEIIERMGQDMVFDSARAKADFGWNPRAFLDARQQPASTPFF